MEKLSRPQSLNELAENAIRKAIVEGQLKFGDHLSEVRLSQMLGISKTPVREALLKMRTEGLIESHPKRGTYVFRVRPEDIDAHVDAAARAVRRILVRQRQATTGERRKGEA